MRHYHYAAKGTRSDMDAGDPRPETSVPYAPGTHAVCHFCGKPIVFVEGYELRRPYWRLTTKRDRGTIGVDKTQQQEAKA